MTEVTIRDYHVSPKEVRRSIEWFESMSDVLLMDENNKIWVKVGDYWYTSNADEDDR